MSSSATPSRTTIALQNTAYHLVGCSAYMALLYKPLSCCIKHTPQYLLLLGPIILYLFMLALHQSYVGYTEVMQNFKSAADMDMEKSGQRCKQESNHTTGKSGKSGKSKRKNHRGGGKAKKAKSKREDTCNSTGSSNSGENSGEN